MLNYTKPAPPSDDKRWRLVEATMRRNGHSSHALIEALHTVQESFGYIDHDAMRFLAASLRIPESKVYGVASFYHFFNFKPAGRHTCTVCTGTACYIKGSGKLLEAVQKKYGIEPGETTSDGELSLVGARCLGTCGMAPLAVVDGEMQSRANADALIQKIEEVVQS